MSSSLVVAGAHVHSPDGVLSPGWVRVVDGCVAEVGSGVPASSDLTAHRVTPGLVDVHCHGGGGGDFGGDDASIETAAARHRRAGTTTVLASLVSAPIDVLADQVSRLRDHVGAGTVAGIHLEGPWIAASRCGAHDPRALRAPERSDVDRLLRLAVGNLRMVTLAPELPGALDAVRHLVAAGVVVAVGHTDADAATVTAAIDAGATVATHLFNAMPPLHHREPGPVGALLSDPRVVVELIDDGAHLDPTVVDLAIAAAGPRRWMLVTDAISAAGQGDGVLSLGGLGVVVTDGRARLVDSGELAGSTLLLADAVRRQVRRGRDAHDAVEAATSTPAATLRLDAGRITAGAAADLLLLDDQWETTAVLRRGTPVPLRPAPADSRE
jgi:N-acetylglucosamine-6-phosphate deacetylase